MKIVIHDLEESNILDLDKKEYYVISNVSNCKGCFGCWFNTPAKCVIEDGYEKLPSKLLECEELIILTKCKYGCYSSNVKRTLERLIGFVEPYFTLRDGNIHHKMRGKNNLKLSVYVYDSSLNDINLFKRLLKRNMKNFNVAKVSITFLNDKYSIKEYIKN